MSRPVSRFSRRAGPVSRRAGKALRGPSGAGCCRCVSNASRSEKRAADSALLIRRPFKGALTGSVNGPSFSPMQHMFVTVAMHTGYGGIKHVEVSLPYIEALVADGEGKYYMERKPPSDNDSGLRRSRGPTLRRLVG